MTLNDDRLRLAYAADLRDRAVADRGSHPAPEALLAVAERAGSEAVRLEVLDHVMACDRCRRELDLVRASVAAASPPRVRTWVRSPSIAIMALAALLLVVAGIRLYMTSGDVEAGPVLRGGEGVATYPVQWIPSVGAGLAWRPAERAIAYRLEVIDDAGRAVVDSTMRGVRDTSFVLVDSLVRGRQRLAWTVTATLSDGTTITSLPSPLVPPTT
jgi:hypothetical protein